MRVRLHDLSTQEMLVGLKDGMLHAAVIVQVSPKTLAGLAFEELERHAVCVALHPAHPLARVRKVALERPPKSVWLLSLLRTIRSIRHGLRTCLRR